MTNTTTAARPPVARPLAGICAAARQTRCGHCWAPPRVPCSTSPEGDHVARFCRAFRRGLISGPELITALQSAGVFTAATVITAGRAARLDRNIEGLRRLADLASQVAEEIEAAPRARGCEAPPDRTPACTCGDPGCPDPVHQSPGGAR